MVLKDGKIGGWRGKRRKKDAGKDAKELEQGRGGRERTTKKRKKKKRKQKKNNIT